MPVSSMKRWAARSGNRQIMMGGQDVNEVAFGWKQLALSRRKLTT